MAKLSLAEQISQLANPKPKDVDIENFEDRDSDSESGGDEGYDSDLAKEHYVKVGKSKLRDDAPALNPKYKAGTVSRKALYDGEGDGADGFISEDDEEDEEEDDDDDDDEEDDEEEANGMIGDEAEEEEDEDEDDEDMEANNSYEEMEANDSDSDSELSENENDSSARATLKELLREEQKAAKQQAKEATVSDAQKGFAIHKQTDLYETLLDARITFQKAIQAANALPISNVKAEELGEDADSLQDTKSKLADFISQIAKMRYSMAVQDDVFKADSVKLSSKRSFEATLDNMETLDAEFKAYETSVLTKWSQKVQASSAASALNSSKFKALNQSSANQVAATLADMDRLVKRTRMNRTPRAKTTTYSTTRTSTATCSRT
ncbi:Protein BFR2 [Yarrowia sp. B02]|nr:Protein BFR2 [Yarrowia sp. B02]